MRRLFSFALFTCSTTLIACGGEGFDIAESGTDTGVSVDDTGAAAEETGHDAGAETESADTSAAPDSSDASPSDALPASDSSDAGDSSDTCTPNACGGCRALSGEVDASCGACGDGKLGCDGVDALKCTGARALNACGGCSALSNAPGMSCGACGDGKWACDGTDAVKCTGARALNACGGCTALADPPDTACGLCGGGKFVCDGTNATKCSDPVTTPAPGSPCGTCGTSTYACAPDGKSTACSKPDDRNVCGGCGTIEELPGTACGSCGAWTCSTDKRSVTCSEASPTVGATCGTCMRSKYMCTSPSVTTCEKPDDRQSIAWGPGEPTTSFVDVVSPNRAHGLELTVEKTGVVTSLKLAIERRAYACPPTTSMPNPDPLCTSCIYNTFSGKWSCVVPSPTTGNVTASLYLGKPGALGANTSASFAADAVVLSSPGTAWIEFVLPTELAVKKGDRIYVELTSTSTKYEFTWNRTSALLANTETAWHRTPGSPTTWTSITYSERPLRVVTNTCDY